MKKHNILYRAFVSIFVGIAFIVPGLSGGTVLSTTDTLEEVTTTFWTFKESPKKKTLVLANYGIFILIGALAGATVIGGLLDWWKFGTMLIFLLLMIAAVPYFAKTQLKKKIISIEGIIAFLALGGFIILSREMHLSSDSNYTLLIFAGVLAGASVLLPGLSGSAMLLIFGSYESVIHLIKNRDFINSTIIVFALSAIIGLLVSSKIIVYLFKNKKDKLNNASFGLIVASIISVVLELF